MVLPPLTLADLLVAARKFADDEAKHWEPSLFGATDGKAVGTYVEHKFRTMLAMQYSFIIGNSASGIDFPDLNLDIKVTSARQPQSSCPFSSARQKIFGLGYSLLIFVYDKKDDEQRHMAQLEIQQIRYVEASATGDYTMTLRLREMIKDQANEDDIVAYLQDRNLPVDDIEAHQLARELLKKPLIQGYLTISNALQWRLNYNRVLSMPATTPGIKEIK
jgi:hypothetical protein